MEYWSAAHIQRTVLSETHPAREKLGYFLHSVVLTRIEASKFITNGTKCIP